MIVDNAENLSLYKGVHPYVQNCIDFLAETDLSALPVGKHEIIGKDLYCAVSEYETREPIKPFEAHDKYLDLQYIVSGNERIDYVERKESAPAVPYDEVKDILFVSNDNFTPVRLKGGQFAIFFPNDAHRPCVTDGLVAKVKKVVFKIKIDV